MVNYYVTGIQDKWVFISDQYMNPEIFTLDELRLLRGIKIHGVTYTKSGTPKVKIHDEFFTGDLALVSRDSPNRLRIRNKQTGRDRLFSLPELGRMIDRGLKVEGVHRDYDGILVVNEAKFDDISKTAAKAMIRDGIKVSVTGEGYLNKMVFTAERPVRLSDYCTTVLAKSIECSGISSVTIIADSKLKSVRLGWSNLDKSIRVNVIAEEGVADDIICRLANHSCVTFSGSPAFQNYLELLLYCKNLAAWASYPQKEVDEQFVAKYKKYMLQELSRVGSNWISTDHLSYKLEEFICNGLVYDHRMPSFYGYECTKIPMAAYYLASRGRDLEIWKACLTRLHIDYDKYESFLIKLLTIT